jgi:twitching motility protein PilT
MQTPTLFIDKLIADAGKKMASSLHLSVGNFPLLKIDGKYAPLEEGIITSEIVREAVIEQLDDDERGQLQLKREIVTVKSFGSGSRWRVNVFYEKGSPSITYYRIPDLIRPLSEYNLPKEAADFLSLRAGMLVVAGAHGSGKTSLCASLIEEYNKEKSGRIITVEDPVEYLFSGKKSLVEQRQAGRDAASFAAGLEYCQREDADLAYAGFDSGEKRRGALKSALELASGNSLVIWEENAGGAVDAVGNLMSELEAEMPAQAARHLLSDALFAAVALRLMPRIGGGLAQAKEIMINTPMAKSLIREGKAAQIEGLIQTAYRDGMRTMRSSLEDLAARGEIRREEALK